jgi:hypothetical protein
MKTLFTLHAGEVVVGEHIEREFSDLEVWVPAKDTGIDLLLKGKKHNELLTLQVKFSRDFVHGLKNFKVQEQLRAFGWFSLSHRAIKKSPANYWVFVLLGFREGSRDFIIIKPLELLSRLEAIHPRTPETPDIIQTEFWITDKKQCWETRRLNRAEQSLVANGKFQDKNRVFTVFLNKWQPVKELNEL